MRLAHHSYHRDPTRSPNWPCFQLGQESFLVVVWDRTDDVHEPWHSSIAMLLADFGTQNVEGNSFVVVVRFDQLCCNPRSDSKQLLRLRGT